MYALSELLGMCFSSAASNMGPHMACAVDDIPANGIHVTIIYWSLLHEKLHGHCKQERCKHG